MRNETIRRWATTVLLAAAVVLFASPAAMGESGRKVKSRVTPSYPELANRMHVTGSVKIEITVAANGEVTKTKVIGGHPLLVESALDAVKKWKYETGPAESTEIVQFDFKGAQ